MKTIFEYKELLIAIISLIIVILRIYPTKKNKDILTAISRVLETFIPNRKKGGGRH